MKEDLIPSRDKTERENPLEKADLPDIHETERENESNTTTIYLNLNNGGDDNTTNPSEAIQNEEKMKRNSRESDDLNCNSGHGTYLHNDSKRGQYQTIMSGYEGEVSDANGYLTSEVLDHNDHNQEQMDQDKLFQNMKKINTSKSSNLLEQPPYEILSPHSNSHHDQESNPERYQTQTHQQELENFHHATKTMQEATEEAVNKEKEKKENNFKLENKANGKNVNDGLKNDKKYKNYIPNNLSPFSGGCSPIRSQKRKKSVPCYNGKRDKIQLSLNLEKPYVPSYQLQTLNSPHNKNKPNPINTKEGNFRANVGSSINLNMRESNIGGKSRFLKPRASGKENERKSGSRSTTTLSPKFLSKFNTLHPQNNQSSHYNNPKTQYEVESIQNDQNNTENVQECRGGQTASIRELANLILNIKKDSNSNGNVSDNNNPHKSQSLKRNSSSSCTSNSLNSQKINKINVKNNKNIYDIVYSNTVDKENNQISSQETSQRSKSKIGNGSNYFKPKREDEQAYKVSLLQQLRQSCNFSANINPPSTAAQFLDQPSYISQTHKNKHSEENNEHKTENSNKEFNYNTNQANSKSGYLHSKDLKSANLNLSNLNMPGDENNKQISDFQQQQELSLIRGETILRKSGGFENRRVLLSSNGNNGSEFSLNNGKSHVGVIERKRNYSCENNRKENRYSLNIQSRETGDNLKRGFEGEKCIVNTSNSQRFCKSQRSKSSLNRMRGKGGVSAVGGKYRTTTKRGGTQKSMLNNGEIQTLNNLTKPCSSFYSSSSSENTQGTVKDYNTFSHKENQILHLVRYINHIIINLFILL